MAVIAEVGKKPGTGIKVEMLVEAETVYVRTSLIAEGRDTTGTTPEASQETGGMDLENVPPGTVIC